MEGREQNKKIEDQEKIGSKDDVGKYECWKRTERIGTTVV